MWHVSNSYCLLLFKKSSIFVAKFKDTYYLVYLYNCKTNALNDRQHHVFCEIAQTKRSGDVFYLVHFVLFTWNQFSILENISINLLIHDGARFCLLLYILNYQLVLVKVVLLHTVAGGGGTDCRRDNQGRIQDLIRGGAPDRDRPKLLMVRSSVV